MPVSRRELAVFVLVAVIATAGAVYYFSSQRHRTDGTTPLPRAAVTRSAGATSLASPSPTTTGPANGPQPIRLATGTMPTPTEITTLAVSPSARPGYDPARGFDPDTRRVLDIVALQLSLEAYRAANGRYPQSLNQLMPDFAPTEDGRAVAQLPVDPATRQPYEYTVSVDGLDYQLSAVLANGQRYAGTHRATP